MVCEIDKTEGRTCILRSPVIADTFSWSCMLVKYELSSFDVKLKVDLLVDDNSVVSYILLANESAISIPSPDEGSSISVEFRVSRYVVSNEDYEFALVSSVEFLPCTADKGKFLCFFTTLQIVHVYGNVTNATREYDNPVPVLYLWPQFSLHC